MRTASWSRRLGTVPIIKLMGVPGSGSVDRDRWTQDTRHHNPVGGGGKILPTKIILVGGGGKIILPTKIILVFGNKMKPYDCRT